MRHLLLLLLLLTTAPAQAVNREPAIEKPFPWPVAYADEPEAPQPPRKRPDLPRFQEVSPAALFRGGRPTEAGLQRLASLGVKTIVNLEEHAEIVERERLAAAALGMKMLSFPMRWEEAPRDSQVAEILALMAGGAPGAAVYVHCFHGKDRTGLLAALHRVLAQGWEPAVAYREMLRLGFYPKYEELQRYFWWKVEGHVGRP